MMRLVIASLVTLLGFLPQTMAQCYPQSHVVGPPIYVQDGPTYLFGAGFVERTKFYATIRYDRLGFKTVPIINGIAPGLCVTGSHTTYDYRNGKPFSCCITEDKTVPARPPIVTESRSKWKPSKPKVIEKVEPEPKPKAPTMKDEIESIHQDIRDLKAYIRQIRVGGKTKGDQVTDIPVLPGQRKPSSIREPDDKRISPNYQRDHNKGAKGLVPDAILRQRCLLC